jgi:hypothetical protein
MKRFLFLVFAFLLCSEMLISQTSLEGKVINKETGEPELFVTVAAYRNNVLIAVTDSDLDGNYFISDLTAGTYDVEAQLIGFATQRINGVVLKAGQVTRVNIEMEEEGELIEGIVVTDYKIPLIDLDNTSTGTTITAEKIANLPIKEINAIVATAAGVSTTDGSTPAIRGSRSNETAYFIDGIRVFGLIPQTEIEQLQVITGGIEARYGDVTSGIINIISRGPSNQFTGGFEVETSQGLDAFGYNLLQGNISGPILKNKDNQTVLGFRLAGQYLDIADRRPSAIGVYRAPENVISQIEQSPVYNIGTSLFPAPELLSTTDLGGGPIARRPNAGERDWNLTGRLDARISNSIDLSLSGNMINNTNRFDPSQAWAILNWINNPYQYSQRNRVNFSFRHRLGQQAKLGQQDQVAKKLSTIRNISYQIQLGFERGSNRAEDFRHQERLFDYGYFGVRERSWTPAFGIYDGEDGEQLFGHVGYTPVEGEFFINENINPALARLGNDENGLLRSELNNVFSNLYSNVGQVYNVFNNGESDIFTFNLNSGFDLFPGGSDKGRHRVEFGLMYEQRVQRSYSLAPFGLWRLGNILVNNHIVGIDRNDPLFIDDDGFEIYNTLLNVGSESKFIHTIRDALGGVSLNEYVNLEGVDPNLLRLDMFSPQELTDQGLLRYFGYDYQGNKVPTTTTFEDFFRNRGADGRRTFDVAPFVPIYGAAYIQDKFSYKDIIFRVGLRMDYYDANRKVLIDPYSLYDIETASDFIDRTGRQLPASIGEDYKVYVASEESDNIVGFRRGDQWFLPNGTEVATGNQIFDGGLVYPSYKGRFDGRVLDIQDPDFDINTSFTDYKPQVNVMPRLAFSFPISDEAGFFAHYDILVQRPLSNTQMSPLDYFYFEGIGSSGPANEPNLLPQKTIDYEVGFQQKISQTSAIKISAYYKEMRDMIQNRVYLNLPAPINQYEAYGNLDFGTVKGFTFQFDRRRTGNLELSATYTLQFADGSGSDANSTRGLNFRGPLRTLNPLSFDERHRVTATVDYRFAGGNRYNGPRIAGFNILERTGINATIIAVSGQPYTRRAAVQQFGGSGFVGAINGARLPWNFNIDLRADRRFTIASVGDSNRPINGNVYLRVQNLLDTRNVRSVFPVTGDPSDDGFIVSSFGQDRLRDLNRNGQNVDLFLEQYAWRLANPFNFFLPRRIYLGVIFDF